MRPLALPVPSETWVRRDDPDSAMPLWQGFGTGFCAALRRDLALARQRSGELATLLSFFVVVVSLFPLGVGADAELLRRLAPGVLWVAALLSTLLGLPRLFAQDYSDGSLEQLALSPLPFVALVGGKVAAHWLLCGAPLVLLAPLMGLQFGLVDEALLALAWSLLLGTPVLSLIGAIAAALTLGARGGGALLALLVLPLFIPALILGTGAVESAAAGLGCAAHLSLLGALLLGSLLLSPWAATATLHLALE